MIEQKVNITFKTNKSTSDLLKFIAHKCNMTQPELINEICEEFIERLNEAAKEDLESQ